MSSVTSFLRNEGLTKTTVTVGPAGSDSRKTSPTNPALASLFWTLTNRFALVPIITSLSPAVALAVTRTRTCAVAPAVTAGVMSTRPKGLGTPPQSFPFTQTFASVLTRRKSSTTRRPFQLAGTWICRSNQTFWMSLPGVPHSGPDPVRVKPSNQLPGTHVPPQSAAEGASAEGPTAGRHFQSPFSTLRSRVKLRTSRGPCAVGSCARAGDWTTSQSAVLRTRRNSKEGVRRGCIRGGNNFGAER